MIQNTPPLISLRTSVRNNSKKVIGHIINVYISNWKNNRGHDIGSICKFCGTTENITKEHVIPRWVFEKNTRKGFTTNINGQKQTYNKSTIPACKKCNSERLNVLELYLSKLLNQIDIESHFFHNDELENIIRWLEIIDYKFQILNIRKKFLKPLDADLIPFLKNFPLSVMRQELDYSPRRVITEIRRSRKRITVKNKSSNINSLLIFKTSNPDFHFFHKLDDFIFFELPQYRIAFFYFFRRTFETDKEAYIEAKKLMNITY